MENKVERDIQADYDFLKERIAELFKLTNSLNGRFKNKKFTPDGRLVGDIGEIIAEMFYGIKLHEKQRHTHDGECPEGRCVQVKISFQDQLTFSKKPDYYLGFKMEENGDFKEIFNGPGDIIYEKYLPKRKGVKEGKLIRIPMKDLALLQNSVSEKDKLTRIM